VLIFACSVEALLRVPFSLEMAGTRLIVIMGEKPGF
jgi:hypothetical protein